MELGALAPPPGARAHARRRRRLLTLALVSAAVGVWLVMRWRSRGGIGATLATPATDARTGRPARVISDSLRITMEVVNATAVRGLGRTATAWLRDAGFDVVNTTTAAEKDRRDSSLVLYGTGHPEWALLAAKAIGGARIEARPDSLRHLDLTVLVGRSWRPPPQTLYP